MSSFVHWAILGNGRMTKSLLEHVILVILGACLYCHSPFKVQLWGERGKTSLRAATT